VQLFSTFDLIFFIKEVPEVEDTRIKLESYMTHRILWYDAYECQQFTL